METSELFDFIFVDRNKEKIRFESYFHDSHAKTLWIKGKRGLGKTKFLEKVSDESADYKICYVDIKINEKTDDILTDFINSLEKISGVGFWTSIKKNYKAIYNTLQESSQELTRTQFPKVGNIISVLMDVSYCLVTINGEKEDTSEIIKKYINTILKNNRLFICIDNFSRCKIETARFFIRIFKYFSDKKNFRSCIISTDEDISEELEEEIFKRLSYIDITINELDQLKYFYQILTPIFHVQRIPMEDMKYLYDKCNGNPKKLSTVIGKLLKQGGIIVPENGKAVIDIMTLRKVLAENNIHYSEKDFSLPQEWVIFSYLCLNESMSGQQIQKLALYISRKNYLYYGYNEEKFGNELLGLIESHILKYNSQKDLISTYHDQDYLDFLSIFLRSPIKGAFSCRAYEYLLANKEIDNHEELLCRNARLAEIPGWENLVFRYGKRLFYVRNIYEAQKQFSYLENKLYTFHPLRILFIAVTSYETGNYNLAIRQFQLIDVNNLRFDQAKFYYYYVLGKSYNNIGNIVKAISFIEDAINYVKENTKEYVQALNILHMYCFEIPEKRKQSKELFFRIFHSYKDLYPTIWANTVRGCQNFLDNQESLKILKDAESVLSNELEKAYINNTEGFVLLRLNQIEQAQKKFEEARDKIQKQRIHESSYAANNLAICHMLNKDYGKAKEILLEAFLWNQTNYGDLVIQTHLMMCCLHLNESEAEIYYHYLENYMNNHKVLDPIINRKIYMNLAIFNLIKGNNVTASAYRKKAEPYITGSSSEWRYYQCFKPNTDFSVLRPDSTYRLTTDFDPWILIYAHD